VLLRDPTSSLYLADEGEDSVVEEFRYGSSKSREGSNAGVVNSDVEDSSRVRERRTLQLPTEREGFESQIKLS
jgi:hypothetical protein